MLLFNNIIYSIILLWKLYFFPIYLLIWLQWSGVQPSDIIQLLDIFLLYRFFCDLLWVSEANEIPINSPL